MKRLFVLFISITLVFTSCRYATDAKDTLFKETKASTLLMKYEWFKDASAQLDKKIADIKVYEEKNKSITDEYIGVKRSEWARDDREQLSVWQSELAGVKASYNGLSAEYNSQMSKINWRFCNVGDLPAGATQPLPREYKPYLDK
jgi:two-component SAPR family response regulator